MNLSNVEKDGSFNISKNLTSKNSLPPRPPPRRQHSLTWFLQYCTKILKSETNDFRKPTLVNFVVLSLQDNRRWHEPFKKTVLQLLRAERGRCLRETLQLIEDIIVQYPTFHYVCATRDFIEGLLSLKNAHNRQTGFFESWFGNSENKENCFLDQNVFDKALNIINNLAKTYDPDSELPFFRRVFEKIDGKVWSGEKISFPVFVDLHLEQIKSKKPCPPIQPPTLDNFFKSDQPAFFELARCLLKFFKAVNNSDPNEYLTKNIEIQHCRSTLCEHIQRLQNLMRATQDDEILKQGKILERESQKIFTDYSALCRGTRVRNLEYKEFTKNEIKPYEPSFI